MENQASHILTSSGIGGKCFATVIMINRDGEPYLTSALETCVKTMQHRWALHQDYEFLLVDNGSTDSSLETARRILSNACFNWRIEVEPTAGVNAARNAGIRLAKGELLIFVDSDVVFDDEWFDAYLDAAIKWPAVDVFAGKVRVGLVEGNVPDWLDLEGPWSWPSIVVRLDLGNEMKELAVSPEHGPVGPNMAFRRRLFDAVGQFDTEYGLRPGSLVAGAEAEFFDRIYRTGARFVWVPKAGIDHPLKRKQISKKYFVTRLHGIGRVTARMAFQRKIPGKRLFGLTLYRLPELGKCALRWMKHAVAGGDAKRTFFYRGKLAILMGYLHEDYLLWSRGGVRRG